VRSADVVHQAIGARRQLFDPLAWVWPAGKLEAMNDAPKGIYWVSLFLLGCGTALEILDERFARGEIDKDEYENRKRILAVPQIDALKDGSAGRALTRHACHQALIRL
jgi:hypothetical protein